jgi:hypothetical protein
MKKERRWKVIDRGHPGFPIGSVITFVNNSNINDMSRFRINSDGFSYYCYHWRLVEIDENGNTIRTYKEGDTLDGGTVVKQEEKKMNGLDGVSMGHPMKCSNTENADDCKRCPLHTLHTMDSNVYSCVDILAAEVQRLRDEREKNPGVFDEAPENASVAVITWYVKQLDGLLEAVKKSKPYYRAIKSPAQIIAEELTDKKEVQELIVEGIERSRGAK